MNTNAEPFAYISAGALNPANNSNSVFVVDVANNTVNAKIPIGANSYGVAVHPDGSRVYLTNPLSNSVTVIDADKNALIATIPVGSRPFGIAINPAGTRAYVTNDAGSNTVSVIDTATNIAIATVPVGLAPVALAVHPDGSRVYTANIAPFDGEVSVIDTATNSVIDKLSFTGGFTQGIAFHPSGTRFYLATIAGNGSNVLVIDAGLKTVIATVPTPGFIQTLPTPMLLHSDGSRLYAAAGGTIWVIDTAANAATGTVPAGGIITGLALHPDGARLYAVDTSGSKVSVIDTSNNTIISTIPLANELGGPVEPVGFGQFIAPRTARCKSGTATGHNWSMNYSVCGKDGLVLTDVKLGNRLLARRMTLPYYTVLDSNGIVLARCELEAAAAASTPCGSQLRNGTVFVTDTRTSLVLSASYDVAALPGLPGTSLTVVQHYEFHQESLVGLLGCEPSEVLPCARFQPIVLYQFVPPPGQAFRAGINTVQRFEFDIDGAGSNVTALFEDVIVPRRIIHVIPPEFSVVRAPLGNPIPFEPLEPVVAIKKGKAGKVDNLHQTSRLQIDEPTFSVSPNGPGHPHCGGRFISVSPGCAECAHIHWRWGKAVQCVDPTFFGANGAGLPIIRAGSNQDVHVAVSLFRPGEEHPEDYTKLLNGEPLLGGLPVFWYSAFGHQAADTFFLHGGFFVSQP